jgi:methionyl-tRNA formyltransferase
MDAGLDTGPVIAQARRRLAGDETTPDLEADLAQLAAGLLTDNIDAWLGGTAWPRAQVDTDATITRPLRRSDGQLDASKSADELERQVRAYQPWPGTFFETREGRIIIWRARVARGSAVPGTIVDGPAIATAEGLLELVEVQPAGGRRMSGVDLVRGRPGLVGSVIG